MYTARAWWLQSGLGCENSNVCGNSNVGLPVAGVFCCALFFAMEISFSFVSKKEKEKECWPWTHVQLGGLSGSTGTWGLGIGVKARHRGNIILFDPLLPFRSKSGIEYVKSLPSTPLGDTAISQHVTTRMLNSESKGCKTRRKISSSRNQLVYWRKKIGGK